jgi:signal-transduction protein with cAMP-binding, CBS, and nucleotidyltransferase domain
MLTVRRIIQSKGNYYCSVEAETTAYDALQLMADRDIGAVLVMSEGRVVGMFSERDYARKVILKGKSSKETSVAELMSSPVITIGPDDTIDYCMALMTVKKHRHLPVVENSRILGVVSIGDVVRSIISNQKSTIRDLERFIYGADYPVQEESAGSTHSAS